MIVFHLIASNFDMRLSSSTALSPPGSLRHVSNFLDRRQSRIFDTSWELESAAVDNEKKILGV